MWLLAAFWQPGWIQHNKTLNDDHAYHMFSHIDGIVCYLNMHFIIRFHGLVVTCSKAGANIPYHTIPSHTNRTPLLGCVTLNSRNVSETYAIEISDISKERYSESVSIITVNMALIIYFGC